MTATTVASATPTTTATGTATPTTTATGTAAPTTTVTSSPTTTPVTTATVTATATVVPTATRTATPSVTATRSATATPVATATASATTTALPTATVTTTVTALPTATTTATPPAVTVTPTPGGNVGGCAGAVAIPAAGGTFSGTTAGTSTLAGSCANSGSAPERVFAWTPTVSGAATIQTCNGAETSYDSVVYVRSIDCASGPEVACNDDAAGCFTNEPNDHHASRITTNVIAGRTYFIVVDGYATSRGDFSLTVTPPNAGGPSPTPTPVTGACQNPTVIPAAGGTFSGTTSGTSSLAGTCADTGNAPERVFRWTPATSGSAIIQTCDAAGTAYDSVLYLRHGDCAGGTEVACSDDAPGCFTSEPNDHHASRLTPNVIAGETYFIVVDGYASSRGAFSLSVVPPGAAGPTATPQPTTTAAPTTTPLPTVTPLPTATTHATTTAAAATPTGGGPVPTPTTTPLSSGTCAGPIVLPAAGGTFTGTTTGASVLAGSCASSNEAPEVVFAWTPAISGLAAINTCGSGTTYDTVMYVRNGSCGATDATCNDDTAGCTTGEPSQYHGSQVTLSVTAGQTYMIVVDGYANRQGTFSLSVTPP